MNYEFRPLSAADVDAILSWHYDPPYDFYDFESDPEDMAAFSDPDNWTDKYAVFADGQRVGFFSFEPDETVEIGLGMHPELTGKGYGRAFVEAGLAFAREEYDPEAFSLAVAIFNERAIRVYESVGFERQETYQQETNGGEYEFLRMTDLGYKRIGNRPFMAGPMGLAFLFGQKFNTLRPIQTYVYNKDNGEYYPAARL